MIKRIVLLSVFTLSAFTVSAAGLGPIELGVKAGVSTQNVGISNADQNGVQSLSIDNKPAFQLGAMARFGIVGIHVQPELLFTFNRYTINADAYTSGGFSGNTKVKYNTMEVPVLVGLKLFFLRLQAGPVFNIMNNAKATNDNFYVNMAKPTVGYALDLGLDLFGLNFDVRYNGRFAKGSQTISIGQNNGWEYSSKMQGWSFTVGYMF